MSFKKKPIRTVLAASTALITGSMFAAVPTASAQIVMEELMVTAQKRTESLLDVPVAVTTVNSSQIESAGNLIDIQSIQNLVPSLQIRRGNGNRESTLIMRGVGTVSFSTAAEPSVAAVLDGVVLSRAGQAFNELVEIDRVEVLRGPQGTLFGKNASAGVVNVISKGPSDENEAGMEFSYFQDDEFRAKAFITGPLSDNVRYRLNAFWGNFDGHIFNVAQNENVMGYDRAGVRGQIEIDASDDLTLRFIADWTTRDDDCCADVIGGPSGLSAEAQAQADVLLAGTNANGPSTRTINQDHVTSESGDTWSIQMNADWTVMGDHSITSITSFRKWESVSTLDLDFSPNSFEGGPVFEHTGGFWEQGIRDNGNTEVKQFSQELRLASPGGEMIDYTVGLYYFYSDLDRTYRRNAASCIDGGDGILDRCGEGDGVITRGFAQSTFSPVVNNLAAFGQATWNATEELRVIAGARVTYDDLEFDFVRIRETEGGNAGLGAPFEFETGTDNTDFSFKAGIQYDLSEEVMGYFTYSQGYKGPAYNLFLNFGLGNATPIDPETADSFEVGFKSSLFDDILILNVAAYYAEYDNFQANNFVPFDGALITTLTNAGVAETKGFEIDFIAQPTENLSLSGGLAYTDATIKEAFVPAGADAGQLATIAAREGTRLPFAPKWALNISGQYTAELPDTPGRIILGTQYNWQSDSFSNIYQTEGSTGFLIESHGIWNASITYESEDENYAVSLHVKNILDDEYITTVSGSVGGFAALGQRLQIPRDADRYWGFTIRAGF